MFPVEAKLDEIAAALAANRDVVLTAPPGSGKTTCVPPALLDAPWLGGRKIVMLEPRRIAARRCAAYIAQRRGEPLGEVVGYQVRLERRVSAATRLEVVTEGLLAQRLIADPELSDVGLLVFDEFHERSLACDLAFALALESKRALRPDLRLLVMSATLDADEVMHGLAPADASAPRPCLVRAEGRVFPVETRYLGDVPVAAAVSRALAETDGDVLCFLPGEGEIRRIGELTNWRIGESSRASVGADVLGRPQADVLPLYGSLPKEEQDRVFAPSPRRKVVLATSIAETSVTLDGVTAVVDSGLMRVPRFSPGTGMTGLVTLPLTRDRAEQRRGRAGRVRPGVCYRLWTEADDASRPAKAMPEILDADLCPLVLASSAWGAVRRADLPWLTPPPAAAWDQASGLLAALGARDADGRLTAKGEAMARLPVHPRLANMLLACRPGSPAAQSACRLAAVLEEGAKSRETDVRHVRVTPRVARLADRFESILRGCRGAGSVTSASEGALLARAFPDRVAKGRGNGTFKMASGGGAFLPDDDPLAREPFVVCCELDGRPGDARVFRACPVSGAEVEDLFSDQIREEPFCAWDRAGERVKCVVRRRLGALTLGESDRRAGADGDDGLADAVAAALLDGVRQKGVDALPGWTDAARQMRDRIRFLSRTFGEGEWPDPTDARVMSALAPFVGGIRRWRDLERVDLCAVMDAMLAEAGRDRRTLDRLAPPRLEVPTGSHVLVRYDGDEPTVAVRLQECFGMTETPKVADGRVPVVMTLLSPAHRPIQVTKDLSGFWRGAYAEVRKDMRGRYPRHEWPEDPLSAKPTRFARSRRR